MSTTTDNTTPGELPDSAVNDDSFSCRVTDAPASDAEFERQLEQLLAVEPRVSWAEQPPKARINRRDVWTVRLLIGLGVLAIAAFLGWFFSGDHVQSLWLYVPMTAVFVYSLTLTLYEWYCYLGVKSPQDTPPPGAKSVDILTTWCPGEPRDMLVSTLKAIQKIPYPHTTWLCDEGDDPLLRAVCEKLEVRHVTRVEKHGAKAGNINNALRGASGEIVLILDPDHEPGPFFLDRVLGYFDDPKVGFVQCVQGYYNQSESLIARGAAEQSYHFYGPVMTGMHEHGTTQAIGANCIFRRAALDSIGGHATGLAEDMATTLKLYAKGWTSVYVPETLTRGLVPNTLGAYYKQQLKWACGVWDILIESLPEAWRHIGWNNRIHFLHNGLFYARGLFVMLGLMIPLIALLSGQMPWKITLLEFLQWYGPVFAAQLLVRQSVQRWLLEPSEHGFHLVGGFLMNATWWVHLSGMLSAIRRVRIPYIPTPKDDEASDAWKLALPNLLVAGVSVAVVIYGLLRELSPYSLLMAAFALTNVLVLGFIAMSAQQKTLAKLGCARGSEARQIAPVRGSRRLFYALFRRYPLWLAAPVVFFSASAMMQVEPELQEKQWQQMEGRGEAETNGFLLGLYNRSMDEAAYGHIPVAEALAQVTQIEAQLKTDFNVISLYHWWGDQSHEQFPRQQLEAIRASGAVPMITWGPSLQDFSWAAEFAGTRENQKVFSLITSGKLDYYIRSYAEAVRDYGGPVMLRFAHEMDNPQYPWSKVGQNTPDEFIQAWRYVVDYFKGMGATNVTWVWNPWKAEAMAPYYPGDAYVDWIALTLLNFGQWQEQGHWWSFDELYTPFAGWLKQRHKPVLLAEFGSTALGGSQSDWLQQALQQIPAHEEIKGLVFFDTDQDFNWPADWRNAPEQQAIDWRIDKVSSAISPALAALRAQQTLYQPAAPATQPQAVARANNLKPVEQGWQLLKHGKPFEIRGVAYGAGQGWRVANQPTLNTVASDFAAIKAMGANTVRRYHPHWGDRSIRQVAGQLGLSVISGFWLEAEQDYRNDPARLDQLEAEILDWVKVNKDDSNVLMWVLGNEVWGQMKHQYAKPLLTSQRHAYLQFLEGVTQKIKAIDPDRPVATVFEASNALPGALFDLSRLAPSIDLIGINAYYEEHLQYLQHWVRVFAPGKPWFLSEFGPNGYWDAESTEWSTDGMAIEPSDRDKVQQYRERWQNFVQANAPLSLGGVAFSWSDRLEGSTSWFGLTDMQGHKKPAYWALAELWDGAALKTVEEKPAYLMLEASSDNINAGQSLKLSVTADHWPESCRLTLQLVNDNSFKRFEQQSLHCATQQIHLKPGVQSGRYRILAQMEWGDGQTSLASRPLLVR